MKKILLICTMLLAPVYASATDITWADKSTGDSYTAANANETKAAVNSKQDKAFTPTGNISSNTVILAIAELDSEKQSTATLNTAISNNSTVQANEAKVSFDSTSSTRLANTSGTNTGDNSGTDDQTAAEVATVDEFTNSDSTNVQDVLDDLDAAIAGGGTTLVDIVTTSPLTVNGTTNLNDALPGSDADVTFNIPAATNAAPGHATAAHITAIEANTSKVTNATHSGDVTGSGALTIVVNAVEESMLKAVDEASDEECLTYESTTGDFEWQSCGSGSGDLVGPGSATDNAVTRFSTTTGKLVQNSGVIIDDSNNVTGVVALTATGAITGNSASFGEIEIDPSATPSLTLKDSDDAAGTGSIYANSEGGINDIILSIGVEDSGGESQAYIEVDGVSETVDFFKATTLQVGDITGNEILDDTVALATDTSGNYVSSVTANQGLLITGTEGASLGFADCAANQVMKRNAGDTEWECAADAGSLVSYTDTFAMPTTAIAANTCVSGSTYQDVATGVAAGDVVSGNFNSLISGDTGYGALATDGLKINAVAGAAIITFETCNVTAASITPAAMSIYWQVIK